MRIRRGQPVRPVVLRRINVDAAWVTHELEEPQHALARLRIEGRYLVTFSHTRVSPHESISTSAAERADQSRTPFLFFPSAFFSLRGLHRYGSGSRTEGRSLKRKPSTRFDWDKHLRIAAAARIRPGSR